jgi:hypothetical protein
MTRPTTGRMARTLACALTVLAVASAPTAYAQDPAPPPAPEQPPASEAPPPPPPAVAPAPPPPPAPMAPQVVASGPEPAAPASDLDVEVRRWAIGYMGLSQVPVGFTPSGPDITAPVIGLRYWASPTVGIDVGVGIGWTGGSTEVAGTSEDKDSIFGFILQGGLPFALSTHKHVSFQVIPYAAIAHGQTSQTPPPLSGTGPTDYSGTRVDLGVRSGLEVFFGFIGIPELSLSATIGMLFQMRKYSSEVDGLSTSDTSLQFSTTVQESPWDIFAGNVAARYYF